jgi:hypothetical protein
MLSEVPGLAAYWEEDLTHAFCVSLSQSDKVARMVSELVARGGLASGGAGTTGAAAAREEPALAGAGLAAVSRL